MTTRPLPPIKGTSRRHMRLIVEVAGGDPGLCLIVYCEPNEVHSIRIPNWFVPGTSGDYQDLLCGVCNKVLNPQLKRTSTEEQITKETFPRSALVQGLGIVRVAEYVGDGYFRVITNRDQTYRIRRDRLVFNHRGGRKAKKKGAK